MKLNLNLLTVVVIVAVLMAGCKKDKTGPSVSQPLLTKFTTPTSVSTYTYDGQNRVIQLSYSNDNPALNYTGNYTYNGSGTLTDFQYDYPGSAARSVNNYQKVTVTTPGSTPSTNTYTYEYNADGYPTKRTTNTGVIYTYEYIKK